MSCPDPLFDPDNCYHDDSMAYHNEEPMNEDADVDETEYETYDDFGYDEDDNYDDFAPLDDEENTMSHDDEPHESKTDYTGFEIFVDDENVDNGDFHGDNTDYSDYNDDRDYDDSMDGDHDSGMTSAGWGTDEDYGYYGEDY